jgi:hypothetical protein
VPLQACVYSGHIVVLLRVKRFFHFGQLGTDASLQAYAYFGRIVALPRVKRFSLRSTRDRRIAPGVCLLRPNRGPAPRQAVFSSVNSRPAHRFRCALTSAESWPCPASSGFLFGQLETDASLQACAYFGRIVALPRVKRFSLRSTRDRRIAPGVRLLRPNRGPAPRQAVFSSVNSRPAHRFRRALTSAESWPYPASSGFLFGQLETNASLQACAYFGRIVALPRVKRFSLRSRQ